MGSNFVLFKSGSDLDLYFSNKKNCNYKFTLTYVTLPTGFEAVQTLYCVFEYQSMAFDI